MPRRLAVCSALVVVSLFRAAAGQEAEAEPRWTIRDYEGLWCGWEHGRPGFVLQPGGRLVYRPRDYRATDGISFGFDEPGEESIETTWCAEVTVELIEESLARLRGLEEDEVEGSISIIGDAIRVRTTETGHRTVAEIARAIRGAIAFEVRLECLAAPAALLDAVSPAWRSRAPHLDEEVFEDALGDPRSRFLGRSARHLETAALEVRETGGELRSLTYHEGWPVLDGPYGGRRLEFRSRVIPGSEDVLVDIVYGELASWPEDAPGAGGRAAAFEEALISATAIVPEGEVLVVGGLEYSLAESVRERAIGADTYVLVRALKTPRGHPEPVALERVDHFVATYQVGHLVADSWRRWPPARESPFEPDALHEALLDEIGEPWNEMADIEITHGLLWLHAPRPVHDVVEARLKRMTARAMRRVAVDLRLLELSRAALAALRSRTRAGAILDPDWESALGDETPARDHRFAIAGLSGEDHAVRTAVVYPTSVAETEDGDEGGSAGPVEVEDTCGEGIELDVRTDLLADAPVARLRVLGAETAIRSFRRQQVPNVGPAMVPDQRVRAWDVDQMAPLERDVVLACDVEGDAATLLIGRVSTPRGRRGGRSR